MAQGEFDVLDMLAFPVFVFASLTSLTLLPAWEIMGWTAAETVWSSGYHTDVTWADLIALAAFGSVVVTNRPGLNAWDGIQVWIIIGTAVLIIAPPFVPLLEGLLTTTAAGFVAFLLQSTGYTIVSWMG